MAVVQDLGREQIDAAVPMSPLYQGKKAWQKLRASAVIQCRQAVLSGAYARHPE